MPILSQQELKRIRLVRRVYELDQLTSKAQLDRDLGTFGKLLPPATADGGTPTPSAVAHYFVGRRFRGLAGTNGFYVIYPSADLVSIAVKKLAGAAPEWSGRVLPAQGYVFDFDAVELNNNLWVFTSEFDRTLRQLTYRTYRVQTNGITAMKDWHSPTDGAPSINGRLMFVAAREGDQPIVYSIPYVTRVGGTVVAERSSAPLASN